MEHKYKEENLFDFRPKSASDWLLVLAGAGIVLLNPAGGARVVLGELRKYIKRKNLPELEQIKSPALSASLYKLKCRKLIKIERKDDRITITLTEKGRARQLTNNLSRFRISGAQSWDGKWRLIMFDIPEVRRHKGSLFRRKLKECGFAQFQKSIWIFPYHCENEIDFLTEGLGIGEHVTYLTVQIEEDQPLREQFSL